MNTFSNNDKPSKEMASIQKLENDVIGYLKYFTHDATLSLDLAQESIVKSWEVIKSSKDISKLKPFILKVARNLAIDHFRKEKKFTSNDAIQTRETDSALSPETLVIKKQQSEKLFETFSKLKDDYREMLTLYYYNELNLNEIASLLEIPLNTAITRLSRARMELKNKLIEENGTCNA